MYPTIETSVANIFNVDWNITNGVVVPESDDIVFRNGGRKIDATYLYADLADSSKLAHTFYDETTATIIRAYVNTTSRILLNFKGAIRSFDGDRVMAIFIGGSKNTQAVRAALAINWAVEEVIRPAIAARWTDVLDRWDLNHGIGIDTGEALVVRGGARDNNDLISIGSAPNEAAKLSELRDGHAITITETVFEHMHADNKYYSDGHSSMWIERRLPNAIGSYETFYQSNSWWAV